MGHTVKDYVALARCGKHPSQICRLKSGWGVLCDMQYLRGYCILLADPVFASLNDLDEESRNLFLLDMVSIGDAIQEVTSSYRINYAIMGNSDPYLHAHIIPRYLDEPEEFLCNHPWAYPEETKQGRKFDASLDGELILRLKDAISRKQ